MSFDADYSKEKVWADKLKNRKSFKNRYSSVFNLFPTFLTEFWKEAKRQIITKPPQQHTQACHSWKVTSHFHPSLITYCSNHCCYGERNTGRWTNGRSHEHGGVVLWNPTIVGGVMDRGRHHWLKMGRASPVTWPRKSMEREERAWVNKLSISSNWQR